MSEITIYTTMMCPFCHRAKALLKKKNAHFKEIDVTMDPKTRRTMTERAGSRSVPQIFVDDQHIGDCDEIYELDFDGLLDAKLGIESAA